VKRLPLLLAVLVVPSSHAARLGGEPVALVTAEMQNRLVVVDLSSGRVLQRLRMPADPQNVETAETNDAGVVVSTRAGAVTLLALPGLRVRRTIRGFGAPHIAAFSPSGSYLYVTDDARGELVVIGVRRARVLSRLFVGRGAHHLAVSPDGRLLWIALGERAKRIVIVGTANRARPRLIGGFAPNGLAHDLAFTPDGRRVWVTYDDRSTVSVLAAGTRRLIRTLPAGSPPQHVAMGRNIYLTSGNDGILRVFTPHGRLIRIARIPFGSYNLGLGGGFVLVASLARGTLTMLSEGGELMRSNNVAPAARDVAFAVLP
jgi:DNA-binding beta-propeller fold protein YncE